MRCVGCCVLVPTFVVGFLNPAVFAQMQFVDATASSQLAWEHDPPLVGCGTDPFHCFPFVHYTGGAMAGDFDRDGWCDVFLISDGTKPDAVALNNGDGTFTVQSANWGLTQAHRGGGGAVGDYNGDGWLDVYVMSIGPAGTIFGPGQHRLYRNNGDGTFTNVAAQAGVAFGSPNHPNGYGAAFGDYDLDGDLDLAVTSWHAVGSPLPNGNRLFRNNGDGTFTDVTAAAGINASTMHGLSVAFVDMNDDRFPELLYASDFGTARYYRNNGDGTFTNLTPGNGTGLDQNGMGHAFADFDGDGRLDWYVTNIYQDGSTAREGNRLYLNQGAHQFIEAASARGADDGGWGWGTVAQDFDNDGDFDIAETNGWGQAQWIGEQCYMFENDGSGVFSEIAATCGLSHQSDGRGMLNLDYDRDGWQDLIVVTSGGFGHIPGASDRRLRVYNNVTVRGDRRWLTVHLDTSANPDLAPDGFGAHVFVRVGSKTLRGVVHGGTNYISMSELSAHFGLGSATQAQSVLVRWPNGKATVLAGVAADQILTIAAPASFLPGDSDGDGDVDFSDLNAVLAAFGLIGGGLQGDVNGSGAVDFSDLNAVLSSFGETAP